MKDELTQLCHSVKEAFQQHGLNITSLHYFVPERFQNKRRGLLICFDGFTNNLHFFGKEGYENWRRIELLRFVYERGLGILEGAFPDTHIALDVYVRPREPYVYGMPVFSEPTRKIRAVDVTVDHDVEFAELSSLLKSGEVEEGSTIHTYCRRYQIDYVLKHGLHTISPDSASVEVLEAVADVVPFNSVLEIGAGVGICGVAAERRGVRNFTFCDINPKVCDYLRQKFPSFKVICADAMEFEFQHDYRLVSVGVPYEIVPWFLAKKGTGLSGWTDIVVIQSGCPAFFEFEHDWIAGSQDTSNWPWWRASQTLGNYFPYVTEMHLDWQLVIVGCRYKREFSEILGSMTHRGFAPASDRNYQHIKV